MKNWLLVVITLCGYGVGVYAQRQSFGYSYSTGRENVQLCTPIATVNAERPQDIWAVSGNLQPFGSCAKIDSVAPIGFFATEWGGEKKNMVESRVVALDRDGLMQEQHYRAAMRGQSYMGEVTPNDLACSGARRAGPPGTGGENPTNPDLLPVGDIDWVCVLLLVGLFGAEMFRLRTKKRTKAEDK